MLDPRIPEGLFTSVELCGSRVTCDPPPTNTDADYLCVVRPHDENAVANAVFKLQEDGFKWEGSEHYQVVAASDFMSWRKDDLNLIVTASEKFIGLHRTATALCKRLNLMRKDDRIALFQAVLYGVTWAGDPSGADLV